MAQQDGVEIALEVFEARAERDAALGRLNKAIKILSDGLKYPLSSSHLPKKVASDALAALGVPRNKQPGSGARNVTTRDRRRR